jgi:hypothetical protein
LGLKARRVAWGCALLLGCTLIASCAAPRYTYIADGNDYTYFKVPWGWQQVSSSDLCTYLAHAAGTSTCPTNWRTAYEADSDPSPEGYFDFSLTRPFVYAEVEPYTPPNGETVQQDPLTVETLADFFLPFTSDGREEADEEGILLPGFKQLRDTAVVFNGGYVGFRETFDYTEPGVASDTFDEDILTNSTGSTIYLLVTHCTTTCYSQHETAINDVMSSFTIRS